MVDFLDFVELQRDETLVAAGECKISLGGGGARGRVCGDCFLLCCGGWGGRFGLQGSGALIVVVSSPTKSCGAQGGVGCCAGAAAGRAGKSGISTDRL